MDGGLWMGAVYAESMTVPRLGDSYAEAVLKEFNVKAGRSEFRITPAELGNENLHMRFPFNNKSAFDYSKRVIMKTLMSMGIFAMAKNGARKYKITLYSNKSN